MNRLFSVLLLFPILFSACIEKPIENNSGITIGNRDTIHSNIFNEDRVIWVSVPSDFNKNYPPRNYPVVFLLDGPDHFLSTVGLVDRFSTTIGSEVCPQMIIVGIESYDRYRDFVPEFGEDRFSLFLSDELIPYIQKNYPTNPFKVLIGHSLAGLRVIHTALYYPNLFNSYIAIDPSLGNERNKWYNIAQTDIGKFYLNKSKMFVAMAQTMPKSKTQDISEIKKDTSSDSNHMRMIMAFSEIVTSKNEVNNASFKWKFYPEESHSGVTQIATYDGLKFIFDWYQNKYWGEILDVKTSPEKAIQLLRDHYSRISNNLGSKEIPLENSNNIFIDFFIGRNQKEKAYVFAAYNVECYPDSKEAKNRLDNLKNELNRK